MTINDLVNLYFFNYTSSKYRNEPFECGCTMVEEMNEIRNMYWHGNPIKDVLKECVCQRHGHQYCLSNDTINTAVEALLNSKFVGVGIVSPLVLGNKLFDGFVDFEQLYDFVASVIAGISGIGPLTVYDTAKRIGHLFDPPIYPNSYVYLSAGAMDGAKVLLEKKNLKFREPISMFEPYFSGVPSIFIEDILCIFKSTLANLEGASLKSVLDKSNCVFKTITDSTII